MINKLINLADYLDESGFKKEANILDVFIIKFSEDDTGYYDEDYEDEPDGGYKDDDLFNTAIKSLDKKNIWVEEQYDTEEGYGVITFSNGERYYYDIDHPPSYSGENLAENDLIAMVNDGAIHILTATTTAEDIKFAIQAVSQHMYGESSEPEASEQATPPTESSPTGLSEEDRGRRRINSIRNVVNKWSAALADGDEGILIKLSELTTGQQEGVRAMVNRPYSEEGLPWKEFIEPFLVAWAVSKSGAIMNVNIGSSIELDGIELLIMNVGESSPGRADQITAWSKTTGAEIYTFPSIKD